MQSFRIFFLGAGLVFFTSMLALHADEKSLVPSDKSSIDMFSAKLKQHREEWDKQFRLEQIQLRREQSQRPTQIHLLRYLRQQGRKLNCYFSIERMITRTDQQASALNYAMVSEVEVTSIDELISKLENDLDEVTVIRSPGTPPIIRLVETSLANMEDYPLNQNVTLAFSGQFWELGNQIKDRLPNVEAKLYGTIPDPGLEDPLAEVQVSVTQESIITLMNQAAPRTSERWVLWGAETWLEEGKPRTYLWIFSDPEISRKQEEKEERERERMNSIRQNQ